ncbi:hypothetical protein [Emcibacter sp. SYSU 3D8]|uniref:hypothetical protein n=1 Tax=Emcibacter sp. SYSU 3D8 TaxID=3133969 RepID=UPI0031FEF514
MRRPKDRASVKPDQVLQPAVAVVAIKVNNVKHGIGLAREAADNQPVNPKPVTLVIMVSEPHPKMVAGEVGLQDTGVIEALIEGARPRQAQHSAHTRYSIEIYESRRIDPDLFVYRLRG